MTHYGVAALVRRPDNLDDIKAIYEIVTPLMEPYSEHNSVEPYKRYVSGWRIQAFCDRYGITTDDRSGIEEYFERWFSRDRGDGIDEQGIYEMLESNPVGRWDYWGVWGYEELENKWIVPVGEVPDSFFTYALVTPDGKWHARGEVGWFGSSSSSKTREEWHAEFRQLLLKYPDCYLVTLDCHT